MSRAEQYRVELVEIADLVPHPVLESDGTEFEV